MKKEICGPARDRGQYDGITKAAVHEFKPCGNFGQATLPDSREFKGDLLASVRQALSALYILENHLVEALDRDEEGGR